jgi:general secretion pathway protein D
VSDNKMTTEAANAARQAFNLRHIGFDNSGRAIVIRDKLSKAKEARVLLERLIRPPAQVAIDVQIITIDDQSTLEYGLKLQNTFPVINFGRLLTQGYLAFPKGFINYVGFGGGRTLFGIGVIDPQIFATATEASARSIYDSTVVVSSGETAQMHVGDKFPIATMLYTGASQLPNANYGPLPQIQQVDLGILIKVKPRLHADGDISMDIRAEYQALGTRTFNTVPEILERQFEGNVRLHKGDVAILAGLDTQTNSVTRTGLAGLSQIPKVGDLFTDVNRTQANSQTFLVVKPHPLSEFPVLEQESYDVGGQNGRKVLL